VHDSNGAYNVVFCNVTALDVTYLSESPSAYTLLSASPTSLVQAQYIATFAFEGPNYGAVADAVDGTGLITNEPYEQAYGREMARRILASSAFLYIGRESETPVGIKVGVNGSRLKIAPLATVLASSFLYG
jgi:hypothetical protein